RFQACFHPRLLGPRQVDIKRLQRRPDAAHDFAGPQLVAKQRHPAVLRFADRAKCIARVSRLVCVEPAMRQFILQDGILLLCLGSCAHPESLLLKTLEHQTQLFLRGLREHQAPAGCFPEHHTVQFAEFANSLQVAEEIDHQAFLRRQWREGRAPDLRRDWAAQRFATLGLQQFQSDGLCIVAELHRLNIQGIGRQVWRDHFRRQRHSSSMSPNFSLNSSEALRTSSQSKKASGVSSQMRNHSAISFFSSRLGASTLRLCEIISARRLPNRAISSTRSMAAASPWALKRRSSSSSRVRLTSASLSVLKCRMSSNSSSKRSSASSRSVSCTFQPVSFSTSAI